MVDIENHHHKTIYSQKQFLEDLQRGNWAWPVDAAKLLTAVKALPEKRKLQFILTLFLITCLKDALPNHFEAHFSKEIRSALPQFEGLGFQSHFYPVMLLYIYVNGTQADKQSIYKQSWEIFKISPWREVIPSQISGTSFREYLQQQLLLNPYKSTSDLVVSISIALEDFCSQQNLECVE